MFRNMKCNETEDYLCRRCAWEGRARPRDLWNLLLQALQGCVSPHRLTLWRKREV